jgi:hypothetical protein
MQPDGSYAKMPITGSGVKTILEAIITKFTPKSVSTAVLNGASLSFDFSKLQTSVRHLDGKTETFDWEHTIVYPKDLPKPERPFAGHWWDQVPDGKEVLC